MIFIAVSSVELYVFSMRWVIRCFDKFEAKLKASGVGIEYKYRRGTNEVQGLWYTRKGKRFPASNIDRRFSYGNICKHLSQNRPKHQESKWMYADGSIVPIYRFRGVKLSSQQIEDYTAGKAIRVDGCQGEYSTVYLKFVPEIKTPGMFSSNPDALELTTPSSFATSFNHHSQPSAPADDGCSVSGSDTETFEQFKAQHPELTPKQALDAWRAKRRGKHLNGGFHMGM